MVEEAQGGESDPLFEPKIVETLRDRRKVVGGEFREEMLDEVSAKMRERRTPGNVAGSAVRKVFNEAADAASGPAMERAERGLERANETILKNL